MCPDNNLITYYLTFWSLLPKHNIPSRAQFQVCRILVGHFAWSQRQFSSHHANEMTVFDDQWEVLEHGLISQIGRFDTKITLKNKRFVLEYLTLQGSNLLCDTAAVLAL